MQNYDLVGCNVYTCSTIDKAKHAALVPKVSPIPIGLDLHSAAEKRNPQAHHVPRQICDQRLDLDKAKASTLPFSQRQLVALAEFECHFDNTRIGVGRKRTRGEVCDLMGSDPNAHKIIMQRAASPHGSNAKNDRDRRVAFWTDLGKFAFAVAPAGFGLDTHRYQRKKEKTMFVRAWIHVQSDVLRIVP